MYFARSTALEIYKIELLQYNLVVVTTRYVFVVKTSCLPNIWAHSFYIGRGYHSDTKSGYLIIIISDYTAEYYFSYNKDKILITGRTRPTVSGNVLDHIGNTCGLRDTNIII